MEKNKQKLTSKIISDFGKEWQYYNQTNINLDEKKLIFDSYFSIFPWEKININSIGFDAGCGSGRWAGLIAPYIKKLYCIEPSSAIEVAKLNLSEFNNCIFVNSRIEEMKIKSESMDFGYCLGVLHHIINSQSALNTCVQKLKIRAPFLLYVYYSLDNKPDWYKKVWRISNFFRNIISNLPFKIKVIICNFIALTVYYPFSRVAYFFEKFDFNVENFLLSNYRNKSIHVLRTDALDRFGTKLEKRYSKVEIEQMMKIAGLEDIIFSQKAPFWCAVGYKKK